ncbi:restriction endonuclease S subunit [Runella defluvii]|uniref:Restriction endonuclease S subunit n=1 Tax=Runella defluvii TaxID=370973 RepID=A0A7W5ZPB7_9BACT|nr:restriction endonuclease subunit S [Runella defluvii]MBB3840280.1 restriction endonuclease S subunit [Runella defluvii]
MNLKLSEIAEIRFGYYDAPSEDGELHYLQAKHFDESGILTRFDESYIPKDEKSQKHILKPGDILLAGKGYRLFAWQYRGEPTPAVASTLFFVIEPLDKTVILPEYLTTFLNLPQTQAYLKQLGAGTSIPSIRKNELSDLSIAVPDASIQQKVAQIYSLHIQEIDLLRQLIVEKQVFIENLLKKIIHAPPKTNP